jgi:hypothetical protein
MEDKPFKYCFELTVHEFFVSDSILATIEFACDSAEELSRWMMAIESASLAVSKNLKQTHRPDIAPLVKYGSNTVLYRPRYPIYTLT